MNRFAKPLGFGQDKHMTVALKKRADELVSRLKPEDRVELADMLYASVPDSYQEEVDQAWEMEIDRRLDEYEAGKAKTMSSEEVHASVRRKLNEIKARRVSRRRTV